MTWFAELVVDDVSVVACFGVVVFVLLACSVLCGRLVVANSFSLRFCW